MHSTVRTAARTCIQATHRLPALCHSFGTAARLIDGQYPVTPMRVPSDVPDHIPSPYKKNSFDTITSSFGVQNDEHVPLLDATGQDRMREVCAIARECLDHTGKHVEPGITTEELDKIMFEKIISMNAFPAALGYHGFPKAVCTSVNEVLCHGVPDTRPLQEGDIINLDLVVFKGGYYGDLSETYGVGRISDEDKHLIDSTSAAMWLGIAQCTAGNDLRNVGESIYLFAEHQGYTVSPSFAGHGIGVSMHQAPLVMHVPNTFEHKLQPGTALTVEPILCRGNPAFSKWSDDWTIVTRDGSRSAQFEQSILVLEDGIEILTARPDQQRWFPNNPDAAAQ